MSGPFKRPLEDISTILLPGQFIPTMDGGEGCGHGVQKMTSKTGAVVANDITSVTASSKSGASGQMGGHIVLDDVGTFQKIDSFTTERIPERVVHAKGSGAQGEFVVTNSMASRCKAKLFASVGKKTPVAVRFSTVAGERGSSDTARDPRGFAVKFFTDEGVYDLVGNNLPVFFIRDGIKFPDLVHSQKRNPQTNVRSATMTMDFLSHTPESTHMITMVWSDRGTPRNYYEMNGFSVHAYKWENESGDYCYVKYHWVSMQGCHSMSGEEAIEEGGRNPDCLGQRLYERVGSDCPPKWKLMVQVMTRNEAESHEHDPFDATKVWKKAQFPLIEVGVMTLNKNPENYFVDVEELCFSPSHFVSGISSSPDKLLQARLIAYPMAHRWRVGPNAHELPANRSKCPIHGYQRDGPMRLSDNGGSGPNYYPNSFGGPVPDAGADVGSVPITGVVGRHEYALTAGDFEQAGVLYRQVMSESDRVHLVSNLCHDLCQTPEAIQYRIAALMCLCDEDYGYRLADGLKIDRARVKALAGMSQKERIAATPVQ